jgi:hypothetical protein
MSRFHRFLPLAGLIAIAGCSSTPAAQSSASDGGDAATSDGGAQDGAATDGAGGGAVTCDAQFGANVCHGIVDPTTLGSGIHAVPSQTANGKPGLDFFCRPADPKAYGGVVLLHFVGTLDDPELDNAFPRLACSLGYAAIAPMWENAVEVGVVCDPLAKTEQATCYGETRRAILYGDKPQIPPVDVSVADSIMNRTATLLAGLASIDPGFSAWKDISDHFVAKDLSSFILSGHSQGSGYALMLGGDFAAQRVVMLAGPDDRVDSGKPDNSAPDWLASFPALPPKTPPSRYYAYYNDGDTVGSVPQYQANYDLIHVGATQCDFVGAAKPAYPPACRRVVFPAGCTDGLNAHGDVTVATFGAPPTCALGGPANDNQFAWRFLLTNP